MTCGWSKPTRSYNLVISEKRITDLIKMDESQKSGDILSEAIVKGDLSLVEALLIKRHSNGLAADKYLDSSGNSAYTIAIQEGYVGKHFSYLPSVQLRTIRWSELVGQYTFNIGVRLEMIQVGLQPAIVLSASLLLLSKWKLSR